MNDHAASCHPPRDTANSARADAAQAGAAQADAVQADAAQAGEAQADAAHARLQADAAVEGESWRRLRECGDARQRDTLIRRHLPYARIVAAAYYARRTHDGVEFAEYLQLASIGLVESVDRYDPARGAQFRTFAARRMHGAILDGLERLSERQQQIAARQRVRRERLGRNGTPAAEGARDALREEARPDHADRLFAQLAEAGVGLALGCLLEGTAMLDDPARPAWVEGPCHPLELEHLRREVRALVPRLPEPARTVVRVHYLEERGLDHIAATLGVTKGRVSQIHRQALAALRVHLRVHAPAVVVRGAPGAHE